MFIKITKSRIFKPACVFVAIIFLSELIAPNVAIALTGGPSQPEVQSFEPIGTTEMVDPFSGDFVYNIPLLDIGGYPVNLSYHSGISMDQEASWVGLGWNINAGVINRGMRGMPDDFKGDQIKKTFNMRPNDTWGANLQIGDIEIIGAPFINLSLGIGFGIFYNNYKGVGYELSLDPTIGIGDKEKGSLNIGLGLSANSQEGVGVEPSLGFSVNATNTVGKDASTTSLNAKIGAPYNSRSGLKALTLGASVSSNVKDKTDPKRPITTYKSASPGVSTAIPVNMQTYIPQISMSMLNSSITVSAGIGGELKWTNLKGRLSAYWHDQRLMFKELELPAYGYMYSDAGQDDSRALHDFNREKDGAFTNQTPSLALTNHTYDVYNVSAQGVGGMYRPYRGDVGRVFDNSAMSISAAVQAGGDLGAGDVVKGGINGGFNFCISNSGDWSDGLGTVRGGLSFKPAATGTQYEPYYFKQAGELVPVDNGFYGTSYGGDNPLLIGINKEGDALSPFLPATTKKVNREKRNQVISILNAAEASNAALPLDPTSGHNIYSYGTASPTASPRIDYAKADHISELSVLKPDGSRYVFGIPAYNLKQKEVTFNINGNKDCATGLVTYTATGTNPDNSTKNQRGIDNYYQSTELPPYAHSYLLTAVLSPDYVDRTGDGPTDDDFGTFTKFNYNRIYGTSNPYKWRVPFLSNKANYNEGMKSDEMDDKASYVYGEKEVWYLYSIETKTHIAEFTMSVRNDSHGVSDENGGNGGSSQALKKLDEITLYAKCDRNNNPTAAEVIKKVNFVYDYSLCPGVDNNDGNPDIDPVTLLDRNINEGKLTLKKVFFTYGSSWKGKLSPYEFIYADPDHDDGTSNADYNPGYDMKEYDRWGNYKPNDATTCSTTSPQSNSEFPYVKQDIALADKYSQAWHLTTVLLPSGGVINIDYESDDYAFVQDKRAMQMVKVEGLGSSSASMAETTLFNGSTSHRFIKFILPDTVSGTPRFVNKYLRDENGTIMDNIYFRFFIDAIGMQGGSSPTGDEFEYVSGYADIQSYGVVGTGPSYNQAYIEVKSDDFKDKPDNDDVNPIAKAAWQFARLHLGKLVYPGSEPNGTGESALRSLLGLATDVATIFKGFNKVLRDWGFGQRTILEKSVLRLYNPDYHKLGGGTRVKKLTISDNWKNMVAGTNNGEDAEYGQEYSYEKKLEGSVTTQNRNGITISSGVAEYEPMIGNEENPWRQPRSFTNANRLAPDDQFYQETPYGEMFFPSASIGYSRVTVRNIKHTSVKRTATGHIVHEFYTARDFPVYTSKSDVDKKPHKPSWITKILKIGVEDYMTVSQGFVIELNDMHGKPKAQWVYPEYPDGTDEADMIPISGVQYTYRTDQANSKKLSNEVTAINNTGQLVPATVGKEMDITADFRENNTFTMGGSFQANLDVSLFPFPPPPIPIPSFWVSLSSEKTRFRSAATTKVITRYGILKETTAFDLGSRVSTQNVAYDNETGEVLLTKTQNDFNDPVYSFTYPAHWAYNGMGMAFKNIGLKFSGTITAGSLSIGSLGGEFINPGDELLLGSTVYWVTDVAGSIATLRDRDGIAPADGVSGTFKIIRSGRRNMQTTPIGTVTSKTDPTGTGTGSLKFSNIPVLNAGVVEFSDEWSGYCECGVNPASENTYISGSRGSWRPKRSLLYLVGRTQSDLNNNTNIRSDGNFKNFIPYWNPPSAGEWKPNPGALNMVQDWTFTSEVTLFSPFGFELENKDALERYSAAAYGFDNTVPTAVASNSRYKEIGFESFEDQDCRTCPGTDDHFSFPVTGTATLSQTEAHTGKNSIKLLSRQHIEITKIIRSCDETN